MTRRKQLAIVVVALTSALIAWPTPAQNECVDFSNFAIIATNSVEIDRATQVGGDVVVNQASPGPTLVPGFELSLDRGAEVDGDASADSIEVRRTASVTGTVFYNDLFNDGSVGGESTPLDLPVLDQLPAFEVADVRDGSDDVDVGEGETLTLPLLNDEGSPIFDYGDITVASTGTLVFDGGSFDVRSIIGGVGGSTQILFGAPTELRIEGRLEVDKDSTIGPEDGSGITAAEIRIYVAGTNLVAGEPTSDDPAVGVGQSVTVDANIYAPNGTIFFAKNAIVSGALIAKDVWLSRDSTLSVDSGFANEAPTGEDQAVTTAGTDPISILLVGSDPEGQNLSFSIEVDPAAGTLSGLTPIVPDPLNLCSLSGISCTVDSDCPGFAEGETCETVQPPVTSATVTYTPDTGDDVEDGFTFGVADPCGLLGTGQVTINPVDPSDPPPGLDEVVAVDQSVDVVTDSVSDIALDAGAPEEVAELTYAVETLPSGELRDSEGTLIETVPHDLPSRVVTYTAPSAPGTDGFTFSARDATTGSPPCSPPSCDTASVSIGIDSARELAEDQEVETFVDRPVQISLPANPGGSGGGSSPRVEHGMGGPGEVYAYSAPPIATGGDNGALPEGTPRPLAALALPFDAGWSATTDKPPAFFWSGTIPVFADDTYTFTGEGCLSITDDFVPGDQFNVYDNGNLIGTTPAVPSGPDVEVGPDAAYLDPTYSSGSFEIEGTGFHEISIELIGASLTGGRGYIRVDTGGCRPNLAVTEFSAPASALLDEIIGDQITTTVINNGFADIPEGTAASIGYYVSTDASITTGDRLLAGGRENLSVQAPGGLAVGESVSIDLFDGAHISSSFPDEMPLTGNVFIGVLVDEFDDVDEFDETDNDASQAIEVIDDPTLEVTWTISTLPEFGTLTDLSGNPITVGTTFDETPTVVYTPDSGFTGTDEFSYEVAEGLITDSALVSVLVQALGDCVNDGICDDGRGDGGGGGQPDTEAGPGLTVIVEGSGTVSSNPRQIRGGVAVGHFCSDKCTAQFPDGSLVALFARPVGAGWEFAGWSGDCQGGDPVTTVRMTTPRSCRATFRQTEQ